MATYFSVYMASGKARCRLCDDLIKVGEIQVNATGGSSAYTTSGNVHWTCLQKQVDELERAIEEVSNASRHERELT